MKLSGPRGKIWRPLLTYASLVMIAAFSLIPVLWMVSTSIKPEWEIFSVPPVWFPSRITWDHYMEVFTDPEMVRYFINTLIIASGSTSISLLISVFASYGFARYRFPGSGTLLVTIIFSRMLPRVALIVPFFIVLRKLSLINKYPGIILVYLIIGMPLCVWLVKGFFDNIPVEIEESGIIDGCSPLMVLFKLILPISAPAIGAVAMYSFILAWNEFLFALVYTTDASTQPLSIGLAAYKTEIGVNWGSLMAASVLMSIPAVLVLSLFQKSLVSGLTEGALKG